MGIGKSTARAHALQLECPEQQCVFDNDNKYTLEIGKTSIRLCRVHRKTGLTFAVEVKRDASDSQVGKDLKFSVVLWDGFRFPYIVGRDAQGNTFEIIGCHQFLFEPPPDGLKPPTAVRLTMWECCADLLSSLGKRRHVADEELDAFTDTVWLACLASAEAGSWSTMPTTNLLPENLKAIHTVCSDQFLLDHQPEAVNLLTWITVMRPLLLRWSAAFSSPAVQSIASSNLVDVHVEDVHVAKHMDGVTTMEQFLDRLYMVASTGVVSERFDGDMLDKCTDTGFPYKPSMNEATVRRVWQQVQALHRHTQHLVLPAKGKPLGSSSFAAVWPLFKLSSTDNYATHVLKIYVVAPEATEAAAMLLSSGSHRDTPEMLDALHIVHSALGQQLFSAEFRAVDRARRFNMLQVGPEEINTLIQTPGALFHVSVSKRFKMTLMNLEDRITALQDSTQLALVFQYAVGYAYSMFRRLHLVGVVHGDLHLDNVMLSGDGHVHIVDWDASSLVRELAGTHIGDTVGWSNTVLLPTDDSLTTPPAAWQYETFNAPRPAQDALYFVMQVFLRAGSMANQAGVPPLSPLLNAWVHTHPAGVKAFLLLFSKLRQLLGPGNMLLDTPRRALITEGTEDTFPSYLPQAAPIGRTAKYIHGGTAGRSVTIPNQRLLAAAHLRQLVRHERQVLDLLDTFMVEHVLSSEEDMRAGRVLLRSLVGDDAAENQATSAPARLRCVDPVTETKLSDQFRLGTLAVVDIQDNCVFTLLPEAWAPAISLRDSVNQLSPPPELVACLYVEPGFLWWRSETVLETGTPWDRQFRFTPTNARLYLWNRKFVDLASPLYTEAMAASMAHEPHTRDVPTERLAKKVRASLD